MTPDDAGPEPEIDPISARYVWGPEAMAAGLRAHGLQQVRPGLRIALGGLTAIILLSGVAILIFCLTKRPGPDDRRVGGVALGIVFMLFGAFAMTLFTTGVFQRATARKVFQSSPNLAGLVDWVFGPDEIHVQTELGSTVMLWPIFIRVVETAGGFLFYQQEALFQWIPGNAFRSAAEMARLRELARSRVPRYLVAGECQYVGKPSSGGPDEF